MTAQAPYIASERILEVLDFKSLISAVEGGLANFSKRIPGDVLQPVRTVLRMEKTGGAFGSMPVYSRSDDILATKLVTFFPNNKGDLPTHHAIILVFSTETGVLKAILDGDVITGRRTAAASAVSSKYLASGDSKCLAILGSGVQARTHFEALSVLYNFEQIKIWNHRKEGAEKLAEEIGPKAAAFDSVKETVRDADIIVTVTSSKEPVLKLEWVKEGAHINAVGACHSDWSELSPELMRASVVYVDSREGALKESGDIILSKAEIYAELGEVINGTKEARSKELTVFKSLGMAIEDAVSAKLVLEKLQIT